MKRSLIDEKAALDERLAALSAFRQSGDFAAVADDEQHRIILQLRAMTEYSLILEARINDLP